MSDTNNTRVSSKAASGTKKPSAGGYKLLALLVLLLAVGGLFLGLAGKVGFLSFLNPTGRQTEFNIFAAKASGKWYSGSLLGNIIVLFADLFKGREILSSVGLHFARDSAEQMAQLAFYWLHIFLVVALAITLICSIVALCSSKLARFGSYVSAYLTLLAFFAIFGVQLFALSVRVAGESDITVLSSLRAVLDMPTLIIAGGILLLLAIAGLLRRKGLGFLRILLLVLTAAAAFGFFFPQEQANGNTAFLLGKAIVRGSELKVWFRILLIATCVIIVLNLIFSVLQLSAKRYFFFDVGRFLLEFVVILTLALLLWLKPYNMAGKDSSVFVKMSMILMLAASFAAFLLSLLMAIVHRIRARREAAKPKPAPTPAAQPAPTQQAHAQPMSEFERSMADLANGKEPNSGSDPMYQQPTGPVQFYDTQRPGAQQGQPMSFYGNQPKMDTPITNYTSAHNTYDLFMDSLTPLERSEFGDLFIAGKRGELKYLPTYIIGGDNTEFFRKVFIYLGRFRKEISNELLDKIYSYVSKIN